MKSFLALIAALVALPLAAAPTTPASGTLTLDELSVEYTGGPHVNANIIHQGDSGATGPTCQPPVLECDDFALTTDFPEDIVSVYPSAVVRIVWSWVDLSGQGAVDFDCWLYDGDGNLLDTSGASASNPESTAFLLNGGVHDYILRCAPFLAAGDTYTGKIEVLLGEPVEPVGEAEGGSDGLAGVLVPAPNAEKNADIARKAGGGAAGWLLLTLGLLARRRG